MAVSLIGEALGDYRVIAPLGIGGAGAVYLAEHPLLGRRVAVKVLHAEAARNPEAVERCFAEAHAASAIGDPRIAQVFSHGKSGPLAYMVLEHLEGRTLGEVLESGALPPAQALDVADGIAAALEAAHASGLVHGALKAENVFLFEAHRGVFDVKILDFGIDRLSAPGRARSTAAYLAPEQCAGLDADERTDVYALGALLFEMVSGRRPFAGREDQVICGHLTRTAPLVGTIRPGVPVAIEAVIARALEKRRSQRYQSMTDFRAALLDPYGYLESRTIVPIPIRNPLPLPVPEPTATATPTPTPNLSSPPRANRALLLSAFGALFVLVGVLRLLAPPACAAPRPLASSPRPSSAITVTVASAGLPHCARVQLDGIDAGAPGEPIAVPRGPKAVVVSVHASHFLPVAMRIVPDHDQLLELVLVPRPPTRSPDG